MIPRSSVIPAADAKLKLARSRYAVLYVINTDWHGCTTSVLLHCRTVHRLASVLRLLPPLSGGHTVVCSIECGFAPPSNLPGEGWRGGFKCRALLRW